MRIIYFVFASLVIFACSPAFGQADFPDGGFENWSTGGSGQYEEPTDAFWKTLNPLSSLGGPITVFKSTDSHSGLYAAHMVTDTFGTLLIPGLVVSGEFDPINPPWLFQGKPFTDKPLRFRGYYKYFPEAGDSCAIYTRLHRWNSSTNQRDMIAEAWLSTSQTVSSYTLFDVDFNYMLTGVDPDSLTVVLTSSAGAESFMGQVGSSLFVDDISLEYTSTGIDEIPGFEHLLKVFPNPSAGNIYISRENGVPASQLKLIDAQGRIISYIQLSASQTEITTDDLSAGIYFYQILSEEGVLKSGKINLLK